MKRQVSFYGNVVTESEIDEQIEILSSKIEELYGKMTCLSREILCRIVQGERLARVRELLDLQRSYTESMAIYSEKREEFYTLFDLVHKRATSTASQEAWITS